MVQEVMGVGGGQPKVQVAAEVAESAQPPRLFLVELAAPRCTLETHPQPVVVLVVGTVWRDPMPQHKRLWEVVAEAGAARQSAGAAEPVVTEVTTVPVVVVAAVASTVPAPALVVLGDLASSSSLVSRRKWL